MPDSLTLLIFGLSFGGGAGTSWTLYPPLTTEGHSGYKVELTILRLHIAGISRLISKFNFLSTIYCTRGRISLDRLRLYI
jgi:heme/copper-type cytochrome/quinol oxidase subunit 1